MYGSPIIGVHLSNSRRLFGPLGFFGHSFSHVLEVRFARFEIALYIDQYPNALIVLLIYDFLNEVLNRFKCLPSLTDQHAAVAAFNLEKNTLIIRFSADLSVVGNEINDPAQGPLHQCEALCQGFQASALGPLPVPVPVPVRLRLGLRFLCELKCVSYQVFGFLTRGGGPARYLAVADPDFCFLGTDPAQRSPMSRMKRRHTPAVQPVFGARCWRLLTLDQHFSLQIRTHGPLHNLR
jgi:hypothetical protein